MECVEGEDLRRWIKRMRREGSLTLETVLPVVRQVASALDYAHEEKIIHRDIKPGNIMIDQAGHVKVLDFGLAAQIHTSMTRVSMATGETSGTAPYMAPEQWRGRAQGAAADQYALAAMTYEMLAGHLPFDTTDMAVLREVVLNEAPEPVSFLPKHAQAALEQALSKDPAKRFRTCSGFIAALEGKPAESAAPAASMSGMNGRPDMRFASAYDSTPGGSTNLVKRIAVLMEQKEWEKAASYCEKLLESDPENPELYLMMCMISRHIPNEDALRQRGLNLSGDKDFQMALKFARSERRTELETLQRDTQFLFHLKKCLDLNHVSGLEELTARGADLKKDEHFQAMLRLAPPDRKKELEEIQSEALIYFYLRKCLKANKVSEVTGLADCGTDLENDENFQTVLGLVSQERRQILEEIQHEAMLKFHLVKCLQANKVSDVPDLAKRGVDLRNDAHFQAFLKLVPPEHRKELEDIQTEAQINFHLWNCARANSISDIKYLSLCRTTPLGDDKNFQAALDAAPPERKQEILNIKYNQAERCVSQLKKEYSVSDLVAAPVPLATNPLFQLALKSAAPERRAELEDIPRRQYGYFIGKCMEQRHVLSEAELAQSDSPLYEDSLFDAALKCAMPEQRTALQKIQYDQAELFLKKFMQQNQISSEAELASCLKPLYKDQLFMTAFQSASPERQEQLRQIPTAQSDTFLRKCMEENNVKAAVDLVNCKTPLTENRHFCLAQTCASPAQKKMLDQILSQQTELREGKRRKKKRRTILTFVVLFFVISLIGGLLEELIPGIGVCLLIGYWVLVFIAIVRSGKSKK